MESAHTHTHVGAKRLILLSVVDLLNFSSCVLGETNSQMVSLTDELSQKNEELLRHQEEIAQLLSQIVELQHRVKEVRGGGINETSLFNTGVCVCVTMGRVSAQLALEKEELRIHLQASKDAQRQLTAEVQQTAPPAPP